MTALDAAVFYASLGWRVVPIKPGTKHPPLRQWQKLATTDEATIREWFTGRYRDHGVGIATGAESGLFVLDSDEKPEFSGEDTLHSLAATCAKGETLNAVVQQCTPTGGNHRFFCWPDGLVIGNDAATRLGVGLDIRGECGQVLVYPSLHPDGGQYQWEVEHDPFTGCRPDDAPKWFLDKLTQPLEPCQPRKTRSPLPDGRLRPGDRFNAEHTWPELLEAQGARCVGVITNADGSKYELWARPGVKDDHHGASLYYRSSDVLFVFSSNWPGLEQWHSYDKFGFIVATRFSNDFTEATASLGLEQEAAMLVEFEEHVKRDRERGKGEYVAGERSRAIRIRRLSDLGNAERLIAAHGDQLRFSPALGWCVYDGCRWHPDSKALVWQRAKSTVRQITNEGTHNLLVHKWALKSESRHNLDAMIALAATEPGVPITIEELDTDPMLLNVLNGTVDLRTGTLRAHYREDLITKVAPVHFDSQAEAPMWQAFLGRVVPEEDVRRFLQKLVGYSITGLCTEHVLPICWGTGANGKTTFLEAIHRCAGDYGQQTPTSTLMVRRSDSQSNDVARLRGARFVAAVESDQGSRLNEGLIKRLTGGDTLTARFLFNEFFEFTPTHTIWLATNHRPVITGTDHAIWRRILLIPFTVTIPEEEWDLELGAKLANESAGILAWAVAGCLAWQREGLVAPEDVSLATAGYRAEQDILGDFIADRCKLDHSYEVGATVLYDGYTMWARASGEEPITQRALGSALIERGFEHRRAEKTGAYRWYGIALKWDPSQDVPPVRRDLA